MSMVVTKKVGTGIPSQIHRILGSLERNSLRLRDVQLVQDLLTQVTLGTQALISLISIDRVLSGS